MSIEVKNLTYIHREDGESFGIKDFNLTIENGDFIAVVGETGAGKTTFITHLNGLIHATSGEILVDGKNIYDKNYDLKSLRFKVGLAFQYSDNQLFEETVLKDVAFGAINKIEYEIELENQILKRIKTKIDRQNINDRAIEISKRALSLVGLDESYYEKSPILLSGGEKKKVAIAGILAMEPDYLVLDEPTSSLDIESQYEILDILKNENENGKTIIVVSHDINMIAKYAKKLLYIKEGRQLMFDDIRKVYQQIYDSQDKTNYDILPTTILLCDMLRKNGMHIKDVPLTEKEFTDAVLKYVQ